MGSLLNKEQVQKRTINFGRDANLERKNNKIQTTKYSLITFLPKALILQFISPAYYVFLIIAIAQSIPAISSLSPTAATAPLLFVLSVALIKEGVQDYKRHKKDNETNNQITSRLENGQYVERKWEQICVGDFIKIKQDQMIPADIILLHSTEQNSICYVQTANLDGQSNLKTKLAFVEFIKQFPNQFQNLNGSLILEHPNSDLHQFTGNILIGDNQLRQLSLDNLLVRGSVLKNTTQVVGIVGYVGHQTKIMKNAGQIVNKVSNLQIKVGKIQLFLFIFLLMLSLGSCYGYYKYHTQYSNGNRKDFFYLKNYQDRNMNFEVFLLFFTAFLNLAFLIPIQMNISIEAIKVIQGIFVGYDKKMYYQKLDQYCTALNTSIMQELGNVDYVLTDKTGTLTANQMKFKQCWINGKNYSSQTLLNNVSQNINNNFQMQNTQILVQQSSQLQIITVKNFKHLTTQNISLYSSPSEVKFNYSIFQGNLNECDQFWRAVILCHDVVVDINKNQFQGSSPDEVCFVDFASKIGYTFIKRAKNYIEINIRGQKIVFQLLNILPFTHRKRMSVLIRDLTTQKIILYTKGADSSIFHNSIYYNKQNEVENMLLNYSVKGLRTLLFAKRIVKQQQYKAMMRQLNQIQNRKLMQQKISKQIIQSQIHLITQRMESNLQIIGCTAIQDRLQDQVPQTISRLQKAGIIVMMITGDKLQTAQNIGRLSNFIHKDSIIYRIKSVNSDLIGYINKILSQINQKQQNNFSLIIEGDSIMKYLQLTQNQPIQLLRKCKSVIFCRTTPKQKALIVKYVKQKLGGIVLAIGDGGNDVSMIQQANIGVGVIGRQGNQAASSSDFYFAQFKYLDRLLLHHGRWIYLRMSYFFVYYGFKNLALTFVTFYFMVYSAYSGLPAVSEPFITIYNAAIGQFIISYYAIWEQDISSDTYPPCYKMLPIFYKQFKQLGLFSYKRYIIWSIMSILLSTLIYFCFYATLNSNKIVDLNGHTGDFNTQASYLSITLTLCVVCIIIVDMNNFTIFSGLIILVFLTIILDLSYFIVQNQVDFTNFNIIYSFSDNLNPRQYATIWLIVGVTLVVKIGFNSFMFIFYPTQVEKQMNRRQQYKLKKRKVHGQQQSEILQ